MCSDRRADTFDVCHYSNGRACMCPSDFSLDLARLMICKRSVRTCSRSPVSVAEIESVFLLEFRSRLSRN